MIPDFAVSALGIETAGGVMTTMIERNDYMHVTRKHTFSTFQHNQTSVFIRVFEGYRQMTKDNTFVGKFRLDGFPLLLAVFPELKSPSNETPTVCSPCTQRTRRAAAATK